MFLIALSETLEYPSLKFIVSILLVTFSFKSKTISASFINFFKLRINLSLSSQKWNKCQIRS